MKWEGAYLGVPTDQLSEKISGESEFQPDGTVLYAFRTRLSLRGAPFPSKTVYQPY